MENTGYTPDDSNKDGTTPVEVISNEEQPEATVASNGPTTDEKVPLDDDMEVKRSPDDATSVDIPDDDDEGAPAALTPYAGMGKDDLLRFSQTPFWTRMRWTCVILFWVLWFGLLTAVVVLTIVADRCTELQEKTWWERSTIYQVYVRSFYDADGDSVGDIKGIIAKLDYFEELKVDAIVLSSIYVSHDALSGSERDFGYDVINHMAVDPELGTMADFEALLEAAHEKELRVLLDFIPNHTGDQHQWFLDSSSSGDTSNPHWNYYVWADCGTNPEPTNWKSVFGGSAWEPTTGGRVDDCYLHQFFPWQPELNLRSPQVKDELDEILHFWLEKGVDGFRVKNVKYLFEDADMRDEPDIPGCTDDNDYHCQQHNYTTSQAEIHDLISRWRHLLEDYSEDHDEETIGYRILVTDADDTAEESMKYYGTNGRTGAHLPLNYQLRSIDRSCGGHCVRDLVDFWPSNQPDDTTADWMTGHQDDARMTDEMGEEFVNSLMMLKFALPGAVLTYYGEELGMVNGNISGSGQDPAGNYTTSRDPYRTPMQWSADNHTGFANHSAIDENYEPWLLINSDYEQRNVETQREGDRFTHINFYKELVELHHEEEGLHHGVLTYPYTDDQIFSFLREVDGRDRFLIAINFGNETVTVNIADSSNSIPGKADVLLTTRDGMDFKIGDNQDLKKVTLSPGDGAMFSWQYSR